MSLLRIAAVLVTITLTVAACSSNAPTEATTTPAQPTPAAPEAKSAPATPAPAPAAARVERAPAPPPVVPKVTVPAGTELTVLLIDPVSSSKNQAGDEFMASLAQPLVVGGKTVADKGTKVRGRVVDAE